MIVLLMVLWSLCSIYFTRLLCEKKMKTAAISVLVLYVYLIAWIFCIFILDVVELGFERSNLATLHGSSVFHSFLNIEENMSVIPLELLEAIVVVVVLLLIAGFAVVFHGVLEITKDVVKAAKERRIFSIAGHFFGTSRDYYGQIKANRMIRLYCRMNC